MTALRIEWDGQVYVLDLEEITLKQAMVTQSYLGMSIMKAFGQIAAVAKLSEAEQEEFEDSPEFFRLVGALHWLMLAQAGQKVPIADLDFPLVRFMSALFGAMAEMPAEPAAEPGPTVPPPAPALSAPLTETPAPVLSPSTPEVVPATAPGS